MPADKTTEIPAVNVPPGAAALAGTRRLGLALVVISMAQLMLVLDELIVNTALPHIQRVLALIVTLAAIRVRREDLPDGPLPA